MKRNRGSGEFKCDNCGRWVLLPPAYTWAPRNLCESCARKLEREADEKVKCRKR